MYTVLRWIPSSQYGVIPTNTQGDRVDLQQIVAMAKEGKSILEIIDAQPGALRYMSMIERYRSQLDAVQPHEPPNIALRPWQEDVWNLLNGPVKQRRIYWIWSESSGTGKSTFYQWVSAKLIVLPGAATLRDTLYAYSKHQVIWFDLARSDPLDAEMSKQLEILSSGGWQLSTKYESIRKWVQSHIVVTCNRPPIRERLPRRIYSWYLGDIMYNYASDGNIFQDDNS